MVTHLMRDGMTACLSLIGLDKTIAAVALVVYQNFFNSPIYAATRHRLFGRYQNPD